MIEREMNVYESKINVRPIDVKNINPVINLSFDTVEVTSHCEELKDKNLVRYARKRKIRRVKAAGIF